MRKSILLLTIAMAASFATAQVIGPQMQGAAPYVPMLATPIADLSTPAIAPVGATNATTGLVAGATNATLALPSVISPEGYSSSYLPSSDMQGYEGEEGGTLALGEMAEQPTTFRTADVGPGSLPSAYNSAMLGEPSLAQLAAKARAGGAAPARVYTNEDIERMNQQNPPSKMNSVPGTKGGTTRTTDGISIVPSGPPATVPNEQAPQPAQPPQ